MLLNYRLSSLQNYMAHCAPSNKPIPLSQAHLAGFIMHLLLSHYAASTIVSAVSSITFSHTIVDLPDPADIFDMKYPLIGCQKRFCRPPIDLLMLAQLVATTQIAIPDNYMHCCISVYASISCVFLLIGEIPKRPGAQVNKLMQLQNLKLISRPHKIP